MFPVGIALVFVIGCSDPGYDLHFVAPQFVGTIELTIDLKNGQVPRQVNSKSQLDVYEIDVDAAGKAAIDEIRSAWPDSSVEVGRWPRAGFLAQVVMSVTR